MRRLKDELQKSKQEEMENIRQEYEDKIIQISIEKEKDFALILDAKMVEHDDHILDIENMLHRDYTEKIGTIQNNL
jgi:hypothetical protein